MKDVSSLNVAVAKSLRVFEGLHKIASAYGLRVERQIVLFPNPQIVEQRIGEIRPLIP